MDLSLNSMMEFDGIFLKADDDDLTAKQQHEDVDTCANGNEETAEKQLTEPLVELDEKPIMKYEAEEPVQVVTETERSGENCVDSQMKAKEEENVGNKVAKSSRRKPKIVRKRPGRPPATAKKARKVVQRPVSTSSRVLRSKSPAVESRLTSATTAKVLAELDEQSADDSEDDWEYENNNRTVKEKEKTTKSKRKSSKPRKLKLRIRRDYKVVKMVDVGVGDDVVDSDLEKAKKVADTSSEEVSNGESSGEEYGSTRNLKKSAKPKGKSKVAAEKKAADENSTEGAEEGVLGRKKRGPKPKPGGRVRRMSACKICGRTFRNVYLKAHMRTHTGEKPFSCGDCGKNFSTDCYLKMHRQSCHQDPQAFQCDICFRNLASRGSLKEHKRTHSDERPFQCHICQKVFRQPALLINHIKTHSTLTPYQCEQCGKSYKYKRSMEMHKERIHDGVRKSFPCTICNKVFTRKTKLKDHTNWHMGKSRHLCEHCGKRFLSRKTLRTHLLIHEDKKPYPCEVCGKSFRQAHVLKRHITTHTGIKPFHCDVCGKQFIHRVYLIRHDCPKAAGKNLKKDMPPIQNMIMPVYGDALMMDPFIPEVLLK